MKRVLIAILAVLLSSAFLAAGEPDGQAPSPAEDARFDFLKQLAGTWVGTTSNPEMPAGTFEFRVTAGGHAVEEREMVGTDHEMLTVYHMDGKDLVGTHYCMLGNRPRVKATRKIIDNTLTFACNGTPGNASSHAEKHVHGWAMRLDSNGSLHYTGELVKAGTVTETPTFVLKRQQATASR